MRTLRITLLAAAAALLPAQALATEEPGSDYSSTEQGSDETTDDGPGWICADGFDRQDGLCVPEDGTGSDGDGDNDD